MPLRSLGRNLTRTSVVEELASARLHDGNLMFVWQPPAFFTYYISNYIYILYNRNNLQEDAMS